jgi:regulator of replication initiation timing
MKKTYKVFGFIVLSGLIFNILPLFTNSLKAQEREQPPQQATDQRQSPEQIELMRNRLAQLRKNAQNAEQQGHPEQARELRQKVAKLAEQLQAQARRIEQRRLQEIDECINRLRQMVREAEEIRGSIGPRAGQQERPGPRPEKEQPLRPEPLRQRVEQRMENLQNLIGQIRETFMNRLGRIEETFGGLRNNFEQLEKDNQELRAENERLRNQLRERDQMNRPRNRDVPQPENIERPREGRQRQDQPRPEREGQEPIAP